MTSNRTILPDDALSLIFRNLEPCFLINVMHASKQLNKAASSDTVFFDKMHRYFPNEPMQTTNIPGDVTYKAKYLFKDLYAARFATLKSSASRRLLSFIIEEDIEKIRQFNIDGDALFAMLEENDIDGKDMFFYANRANNPAVRSALMNLYLRPFVATENSWNPLKIIRHNARKMFFETELGHLLILSTEAKHIYEVAAAFGEVEPLKGLKREHGSYRDIYMAALRAAARSGHIQAAEYLLSLGDNFDLQGECVTISNKALIGIYPDKHPVVAAAMNNQPEMVRLLLLSDKLPSSHTAWRYALSAALKFRHMKVLIVVMDILSNERYLDIPPERLLSVALRDSAQYDYDELVDLILQKVFDNDALMTNEKRAESFNKYGDLDLAIDRAIKHGSVKSLELMLKRYDQLKQDGFIKQPKDFFDQLPEKNWWEFAITSGNIKVMTVLLEHQYPVTEFTIDYYGKRHRQQPEIADFLDGLLQQQKEADSVSKMTPM